MSLHAMAANWIALVISPIVLGTADQLSCLSVSVGTATHMDLECGLSCAPSLQIKFSSQFRCKSLARMRAGAALSVLNSGQARCRNRAGPAMAARIDLPDWWNCRKDRRVRALQRQKGEHDRFVGLPGPDLVRTAIDGKLLRDLE